MIQLESGGAAKNIDAARQSLAALAGSWGHELTEAPTDTAEATQRAGHDGKVIDPLSLTALVLSVPSAALAVVDLADRIRKRRRAQELIGHARQLAAQQVTTCVVTEHRKIELADLDPDHLLELLADEKPTN
jgi:hypothetical protein